MRQQIIAGNWKLFGTITETENLLKGLLNGNSNNPKCKVIVCPPYTSLHYAHNLLQDSHIAIGGQDMSAQLKGAFTGEVSAEMLLTVGASYIILGHSERRQYHGETDQGVNATATIAFEAGLTPIICVGETLEHRESGKTEEIIASQIDGCLSGFSAGLIKKSVLAYEPVWAIGTGKTATPEMACDVHRFIRERVAKIDNDAASMLPILYGGSVKPNNAESLLSEPDIDGALVGGAALKADDFIAIINAVK